MAGYVSKIRFLACISTKFLKSWNSLSQVSNVSIVIIQCNFNFFKQQSFFFSLKSLSKTAARHSSFYLHWWQVFLGHHSWYRISKHPNPLPKTNWSIIMCFLKQRLQKNFLFWRWYCFSQKFEQWRKCIIVMLFTSFQIQILQSEWTMWASYSRLKSPGVLCLVLMGS